MREGKKAATDSARSFRSCLEEASADPVVRYKRRAPRWLRNNRNKASSACVNKCREGV